MNLEAIVWPVFRLGEKEPCRDDGMVFYSTEYNNLENQNATVTLRVVDDRTINKPTLAKRRLQLLQEGVQLFPIKQAVYFLSELLKLAKTTTWFIDSIGQVFQYKKTRRAKLISRKIKNILPTNGLGAVVEVEGIPQRFKTTFKPSADVTYAHILKLGLTYILYGLYVDKPKESWRLI